jgi:hypothetical protein
MGTLLSAIFLIDEFPHLDYVPWRESAASVLRVADELIVVHGGKRGEGDRRIVYDYFHRLGDPRVKLLEFPWPDVFDWRQIARSCTFGHLQAQGEWCFRILADELLPKEFETLRQTLPRLPSTVKIVSVDRLYLLGNSYACPFNGKPLFFRNDKSIGYGTVNPAQGEAASYLLFDDPLDTDHWFDGHEVVTIRDQSILRRPDGLDCIHRGETPRGYRGPELDTYTLTLPLGIFNTDVNFFPNSFMRAQKELSQQGYQRLPPEYPHRPVLSQQQLEFALIEKIRRMIRSNKLIRVSLPESLHAFIDGCDDVHNQVRHLCEEEYGLPWNRISPRASKSRRFLTLGSNIIRRKLKIT